MLVILRFAPSLIDSVNYNCMFLHIRLILYIVIDVLLVINVHDILYSIYKVYTTFMNIMNTLQDQNNDSHENEIFENNAPVHHILI